MEFKEFDNPEKLDYDLNVGIKNANLPVGTPDNSLNSEEGIDLNMLGKEEFIPESTEANFNGEINEYGEIVRGRSR